MTTPTEPDARPPARSSIVDLAPCRTLVVALGGWTTLGLAATVWGSLLGPWFAVGIITFIAVCFDTILVCRTPTPSLQRTIPRALALNEWHDATIRIENTSGRSLVIDVIEAVPVAMHATGLPQTVTLAPEIWIDLPWRVRPTARGEFQLEWMEMRFRGPLALVQHRRRVHAPEALRVYPNFKAVSRFALLALDNRMAEFGVHTRRQRGQGLDFLQLREYREGDPLRQIDWKAVSRRNQLISREYRAEQNQQVVFLLDCGRRMRTRDGELAFFDHVLNAVLLVSYVALRQGDAVGAYTFSGVDRLLPPRKGRGAMNTLLNGLFDIQPTTAPSDFAEAASRIATRVKRRALVVIVSNLRDEDAQDLPLALAPLRRKHLVLFASLREPSIEAACDAGVNDLSDALRVASAHEYMVARKRAHDLIRGRGVQAFDVLPASLPVSLVNRYLEIKRSGTL